MMTFYNQGNGNNNNIFFCKGAFTIGAIHKLRRQAWPGEGFFQMSMLLHKLMYLVNLPTEGGGG